MADEQVYENAGFMHDEDSKVPNGTQRRNIKRNLNTSRKSLVESAEEKFTDEEGNEIKADDRPMWDRFEVRPKGDMDICAASCENFFDSLRKVTKIVVCILCFMLILCGGVMAKLSLILISNNIAPNYTCNGTCISAVTSQQREVTVIWTWSLILLICSPYVLIFIKNLWKTIAFSRSKWTGLRVLSLQLTTETIHSIGVVILTTQVITKLDLFQSVIIFLGLGTVPSITRLTNRKQSIISLVVTSVCAVCQLSMLVVIPLLSNQTLDQTGNKLSLETIGWLVSLAMVSVRWWPNFNNRLINLSCNDQKKGLTKKQRFQMRYRNLILQSNCYLQCIVYGWKLLLTVFGIVIATGLRTGVPMIDLLSPHKLQLQPHLSDHITGPLSPIYMAVVGLCGAFTCYYLTLHALKSKLSTVTYVLPTILMTPISVLLILGFSLIDKMRLSLSDYSDHIDFRLFNTNLPQVYIAVLVSMSVVWYISQVVLCYRTWNKPLNKIEATEVLFLLPMFDADCLEQSLLYNRKTMKKPKRMNKEDMPELSQIEMRDRTYSMDDEEYNMDVPDNSNPNKRNPYQTMIYFCATMWHENKKEMMLMLKSVLRMDFDHFQKTKAQLFTRKVKSDYYNFETHIFFDDAFEKPSSSGYNVNTYVKQLVEVVPEAVRRFYIKQNFKIEDPVRIPTPYGGRLEWKLPSGNIMIAHLKDKTKIRHKKRWSQVMYMYYLLGEKIMNNKEFSDQEKTKAAVNTYLLALDGDVDFKPEAVLLLVDMMKKNEDVGAACGRIHPLGSGPIVWYQKFEYSIAHWLQKATEHVLGCVLCSPGCFSLFRAEALMSDNVMAKYATKSTKAAHYLQYDQGEDRWLCTLLLQAGYKVEYNAAADALTFAPEGFDEFFNQRRRWGPSTMANILDLIMDAFHVIRVNKYMSLLYVIYQAVQFFASIVGPGTIFMMITGAIELSMQASNLPNWAAFIINLIPILFFIIVSFHTESNFQLKMAKIFTIFYGLIMALVLISVIIEVNASRCSPSSIFFYAVLGSFVISALAHPQEGLTVGYGIVYFILIPCMYMLLIIYSFININNVSWGTREVVLTATEQQIEQQKKAEEESIKKQKRRSLADIFSSIWKPSSAGDQSYQVENEDRSISCGGLLQVVCCPKTKKEQKNDQNWQINHKLDQIMEHLNKQQQGFRHPGDGEVVTESDYSDEERDTFDTEPQTAIQKPPLMKKPTTRRQPSFKSVTIQEPDRDELVNPYWIEDEKLGAGRKEQLGSEEVTFWRNLIQKYLEPLPDDKIQQEKVTAQLLKLRQDVNFVFFLANAMFIVIIMTLQEQKDELYIEWPCDDGKEAVFEPLGLMFLVFFLLVMGIQFIGMLVHRLGTFWHIMASTKLKESNNEIDENKVLEDIIKHTVDPGGDSDDEGKDADSLSTISNEERNNSFSRNVGIRRSGRTTKKILQRSTSHAPAASNLEEAFQNEFAALRNDPEFELERKLRKLSGNQRRLTVKYIKRQQSHGVGFTHSMSTSPAAADLKERAKSESATNRIAV